MKGAHRGHHRSAMRTVPRRHAGPLAPRQAGQRVLRPGGRELTEQLLTDADLTGADVPRSPRASAAPPSRSSPLDPRSYRGVESDEAAPPWPRASSATAAPSPSGKPKTPARRGQRRRRHRRSHADDAVGDKVKGQIVNEANRVLRPGGRVRDPRAGPAPGHPDRRAEDRDPQVAGPLHQGECAP